MILFKLALHLAPQVYLMLLSFVVCGLRQAGLPNQSEHSSVVSISFSLIIIWGILLACRF
jgi:hypothetical protein